MPKIPTQSITNYFAGEDYCFSMVLMKALAS